MPLTNKFGVLLSSVPEDSGAVEGDEPEPTVYHPSERSQILAIVQPFLIAWSQGLACLFWSVNSCYPVIEDKDTRIREGDLVAMG